MSFPNSPRISCSSSRKGDFMILVLALWGICDASWLWVPAYFDGVESGDCTVERKNIRVLRKGQRADPKPMSRRGQRSRYNEEDTYDRSGGQRRVNGDYPSSLSTTSMTRELDDLMRTIEADWSVVTTTNVSILRRLLRFQRLDLSRNLMFVVFSCWNGYAAHGSKFAWTGLQRFQELE